MQLGISKKFQKEKKESALIMRKQTKIAAVVSAAALLALGASMTSFAASKGTWMGRNRSRSEDSAFRKTGCVI